MNKAVWSIADQGLYALLNLIISIILIRALGIERYGEYSILLSCWFFLNGLQNSYFIEPILRNAELLFNKSSEDLSALAASDLVFSLLVSIFLSLICTALLKGDFFDFLIYLAYLTSLANVFFQRRIFYVIDKVKLAAYTSFLSLLLGVLFILTVERFIELNTAAAILCLVVSNLIISLLQARLTGYLFNIYHYLKFHNKIKPNLKYGNSAVLASLMSWVLWNFTFIELGRVGRFQELGILRAYLNLFTPTIQISSAISLPLLSKLSKTVNKNRSMEIFKKNLFFMLVINIFYSIAMILGGGVLLSVVYGDEIEMNMPIFSIFAAVSLLLSVISLTGTYIKAKNMVNKTPIPYLLASLLTILCSVYLNSYALLYSGALSFASGFVFLSLSLIFILWKERIKL